MVSSVCAAELNNTDYKASNAISNDVLEIANSEKISSDSQDALYLSGSGNADFNTVKINNVSVDSNENILQSSDENNILAGSTVDVTNLDELRNNIANNSVSVINIKSDILITSQITISRNNLVVDGNGFTLYGNGNNYRALMVSSSYTVLKNINFKDFKNNLYYSGAVSFSNAYYCNITNCNFTNCNGVRGGAINIGAYSTSTNYESARRADANNIIINNCLFDACSAPAGGAIYTSGHSAKKEVVEYIKFYNCEFVGCKLTSNARGSAIELNAKNSIIENCSFINNVGIGSGTLGLYMTATYTTVRNCTFINNTAKQAGGICLEFEDCKNSLITNCKFINNTATNGDGGAITFYASNSVINNCTFINNTASRHGGAVCYSAKYCRIYDSEFIGNKAVDGGAVFYSGSYCILSHSILENNVATSNGGAIYFSGSYCNLTNCVLDFNTATTSGGAVKFTGAGCNITDCNFTNNSVTGNGHGGAVHFAGKNSQMWYCIYNNNTCLNGDGGALCSQAEGSLMAYCTFANRNNSAKLGNDFYAHPRCTITFIGLKFSELWFTNKVYTDPDTGSSDTDVAHGYGTSYLRPACWSDEGTWLDFLDTSGKTTIYLVGNITDLDEKVLNIENLNIVGYDSVNNPGGAVVDLAGWNHRAFNIAATNVMVKNIVFKNSNINGDGGVIKVVSSRVCQIRNCTFINNTAVYGGAISFNNTIHNGIFIVNGSTFLANKALIHGGAMYFDNSSDFTNILDTVIQDNRIITNSSENAAAYYQSRMDVINHTLYYFLDPFSISHERNNSDSNNPIITNNAVLCREEVYVSLSYALNPGGHKGNGTAYNDTIDFISGIALVKATGGTIHFLPNEVYTLEDIKRLEPTFDWYVEFFKFNIYIEGNNCTFSNFGLQSNVDFGNNIHFMNLTFTGYNDYTPIINDGGDNYIENCRFVNNNRISVINTGRNLNIINSTFINNYIVPVSSNGSGMIIKNSLFDSNPIHIAIGNGGNFTKIYGSNFVNATDSAVVVNASDVYLIQSNFTHNYGVNGGAIYLINGSLILKGNNFTYNTAVNGGALYLENGTLVSGFNNEFYYNNASHYGGAIYSLVPLNLTDGIFVGNNATINGGAIYLDTSGSKITNVRFINNWAINGSAIYLNSSNKLSVKKVICENNTETDLLDMINSYHHGSIYIGSRMSSGNFIYSGLNMVGANDVWDGLTYYLSTIYVNSTADDSTCGTSPETATSFENSVIHILNEGKIIFADETYTMNQLNLVNRTIALIGNGATIKRRDSSEFSWNLDNSTIYIENLTLENTGMKIENNSTIDLDNITFYTTENNVGGIVFDASSKGSIDNSNFAGTTDSASDYVITVNGKLDINNTNFSDNKIGAVKYDAGAKGSIINSIFINNTAKTNSDVRNIFLNSTSLVKYSNNTLDVNMSYNITDNVYGNPFKIVGLFDAGVNFPLKDITLTLNNTARLSSAIIVNATSGFSFNVAGGVLHTGKYNLTATSTNFNYKINYINNEFEIIKRTIEFYQVNNIVIVYGNNYTVIISGKYNTTQYGDNYDGLLNLSIKIGDKVYKNNNTVRVLSDGTFKVGISVVDLGAQNYTILVEGASTADYNNVSMSKNLTAYLNITKAVVSANYTPEIIVVYGVNDTIVVEGTFNASSADYAVKYNGNVTVTINNNKYSITNTSVLVKNGKFRTILTDQGKLGVGIYNITVSSNAQSVNENYTVVNKTFVNKVNVNKLSVGANYTANIVVVYGVNNTIVVEGTFNASSMDNAKQYNGIVTVTIGNNLYSISNSSVVVRDGKFSAVIVDGGKLGAGIYNVTVSSNTQSVNDNYTVVNVTFADKVNVTKAIVGANYTTDVTVVYGMNDTIAVEGTFNASTGMDSSKYNGIVTVTISNNLYSISNVSVVVRDGKFSAVVVDGGKLGVGIYNVTVSSNTQSVNDNYTVVNVTLADKVNVTNAFVGANYTTDVTVIYGMNDTITVEGTFNVSSPESSKYNGIVTVTISNNLYSISNVSVVVRDGKFSAVVVDGGKLGVGIYNVTVSSNAQSVNDNYTVVNVTFADKVNVTKAVVGANYTTNIAVVYGMNDTIIIEGTFNKSSGVYSSKYNGIITVTVNNGVYSISNSSVVVRDGKFKAIILNQPELGVGIYNITVSSNTQSLNDNYTVSNNTFVNKVNVTKAVVLCEVNEITIVYGENNTITIKGNVSNGTNIVKYNGFINITVPNTNLAALNVEVKNGEFSVDIIDKGNLTVGKYTIEVKTSYVNDNYTFTNTTFNDNISVILSNVTAFDLINVTVIYGVNRTIVISGKVSNSTYGVKYNGLINITITNGVKTIVSNNILVVNGTFDTNVIDMGNLTSGSYDVVISSDYVNNYTFVSKTFTNNVTVLKYNVTAVITKVNITYGDYNTINVYGNVSNSTYGQLYNGYVNVVVGNHTYNNIAVTNGRFTVEINDLSNYNVSINNVSVSEAVINDNYVLNNVTFADYFIISSAGSSINISSVTEKYGTVVVIPVISENVTALIATVYTLDGQVVSNINITTSGVSSIRIEGMPIGEFILNVTGVGDNNHIGCSATANMTIIKAPSSLVVDNLTVVYAPGNITVWYDVINATVDSFRVYDGYGNPVSCTIVKHKYTFDITGLSAGNYTFNVTADGGINYENATSLSTITIIPAGSKVIVPVVVITYGEHAILNVTGENITGISSISILDSNGHVVGNYTINNFTVELWNLNSSSASYRVNVTASVDENHTISSGIGLVFVKKAGSAIIVPDNFNITYGDVKTINIELDNVTVDDIIGIYVVSNGMVVNCSISQNQTNITIGGLAVGDYAIIIESKESMNYNASVGAGNFKVLKAGSSITIPSETNMSHLGGTITIDNVVNATGISVKVFDHLGNQIRVSVNGFDIIFDRLDVGEYTLNVTTVVDENHTSSYAIGKLYVLKMLLPSSVEIINTIQGVFNTTDAYVNFDVSNRTVVNIVVFKNGTDICVYNNTNFIGDVFSIGNLTPGIYNITIYNLESDYFSASNATALFEVVRATSFVNITNVVNGVVNGTNATISFNIINRTDVKIIITNSTGEVILTFENFNNSIVSVGNLTKGIYNIAIINVGDGNYTGSNASATFKFIVEGSIVASGISRGYNSSYDYVAIFKDEFGNPLNNTQIQMIVDGKVYNVTTNENGEAYLTETTLPVGLHNITLYNPVTGESETYTTNIVERLQENKDIVMDFADGTYYRIRAYGDDGQPIAGVYVTITINGVAYDVKTDKNGYASLKIRLNPDVFKITAEWKGYKVNKIVVKQTLKSKSVSAKKSRDLKFTATLKWSNGKAIAGKKIIFKFRGKKYVAKTNKKGIATIKIKKSVLKKLKVGKKYKISITYNAIDKGYTSVNAIIKTIKIKK